MSLNNSSTNVNVHYNQTSNQNDFERKVIGNLKSTSDTIIMENNFAYLAGQAAKDRVQLCCLTH